MTVLGRNEYCSHFQINIPTDIKQEEMCRDIE